MLKIGLLLLGILISLLGIYSFFFIRIETSSIEFNVQSDENKEDFLVVFNKSRYLVTITGKMDRYISYFGIETKTGYGGSNFCNMTISLDNQTYRAYILNNDETNQKMNLNKDSSEKMTINFVFTIDSRNIDSNTFFRANWKIRIREIGMNQDIKHWQNIILIGGLVLIAIALSEQLEQYVP